jgi:hypothetical protein
MQSTPLPPPTQDPPSPSFLITPLADLRTLIGGCPHAQSLLATLPENTQDVIVSLWCNQWSCPVCARYKIRTLAAKTLAAQPNRLCTLTTDPKLWTDPRDAFDHTRTQVPKLIAKLRLQFGEVEYLRVTELTKNGWPHYHLLIRSKYIPHPVIAKLWETLTGARIVDIRQVAKHWKATTYLTKYLTKLHRIDWTERHVSYSKNFFESPPAAETPKNELLGRTILKQHPATYLAENEIGSTLTQLSARMYAITPSTNSYME